MPIIFRCNHCQVRLSVSRSKAGRTGPCPNCTEAIRIPSVAEAESRLKNSKSGENESSKQRQLDPIAAGLLLPPVSSELSTGLEEAPQLPPTPPANEPREIEPPTIDDPVRKEGPSAIPATIGESTGGQLTLPRWVVYFQAGLLAVCAATFFFFGMLVGNVTAPKTVRQVLFRVDGSVSIDLDGQRAPDRGAVLVFLPADQKPDPRPDGDDLSPYQFEVVDNRAIDLIRALGGEVIRADSQGRFSVELSGPKEYFVLAISKASQKPPELTKTMRAEIGRFFLPPESVVNRQSIHWSKIRLTADKRLGEIVFK